MVHYGPISIRHITHQEGYHTEVSVISQAFCFGYFLAEVLIKFLSDQLCKQNSVATLIFSRRGFQFFFWGKQTPTVHF